jgi:DNA-binding CsgD family transcriptional regulator
VDRELVPSVPWLGGAPSDRDVIVTVLGRAGYTVLETGSDEQALGIDVPDHADLIFADVAVSMENHHGENCHCERFRALSTQLLQKVDELHEAAILAGALNQGSDRNADHVASGGLSAAAVATGVGPEELLSPRELEVLAMIAEGAPSSEIAARLVIAEATVQSHVQHILRKLGARNRTQAAARYLRRGR